MKYIITFFLLSGIAHAQFESNEEAIEVGSPRDCVVVGKKDDSAIADELNQIQMQITDCLAPQEEEAQIEQKHPEVVSQ
jgi:hypothetical protein